MDFLIVHWPTDATEHGFVRVYLMAGPPLLYIIMHYTANHIYLLNNERVWNTILILSVPL